MHWEASPVLGSTDLPVTDEIHSVHRLVGKHTHTTGKADRGEGQGHRKGSRGS